MSRKKNIGIVYGIVELKGGDSYSIDQHIRMHFKTKYVFKEETILKKMTEELIKKAKKILVKKELLDEEYFGYVALTIDLDKDPIESGDLMILNGHIKEIEEFK